MNNTNKVIPRERVYLMNQITERDKLIAEQSAEIERLGTQYELAVKRRLKERRDRGERRKDILALAVFAVLTCRFAVPGLLYALEEFWRWANGM